MLLHGAWVPPEWQVDQDEPRGRWVNERKKWINQVSDGWSKYPTAIMAPSGDATPPHTGYFFIWAEVGRTYARVSPDKRIISLRSVPGPAGRRQYVSAALSIVSHPFQASARKVRDAVGDMMDWSDYLPWADGLIWLPSNDTSPLPSPELVWELRSVPHENKDKGVQLRLWLVHGIMLTPDIIPRFMDAVSSHIGQGLEGQYNGDGVGFAHDLRYWYDVYQAWRKARQENDIGFLDLDGLPETSNKAFSLGQKFPWAAGAVIDPEIVQHMEQIAQQLGPWYATSIGTIGFLLNRGYVLSNAMSHLPVPLAPPAVQVGTTLASFFLLTDNQWQETVGRQTGTPAEREAMLGRAVASGAARRVTPEEMEQAQAREPLGLRLYLRLVAPDRPYLSDSRSVGRQDEAASVKRSGSWRLIYGLQAREDPSLLLRAVDLWRVSDSSAVVRTAAGPRRLSHPQERLLADLMVAASVFEPIYRSLDQSAPEGVELSDEEAWHFLTVAAPLLQQQGFQVLLPAELVQGEERARLGLTLLLGERRAGAAPVEQDRARPTSWFGPAELAQFDWRVSLGDQELSEEEFAALSQAKVPLIQLRGKWLQLSQEDLEVLRQAWQERQQAGTTPGQILRRVLEEAGRQASGGDNVRPGDGDGAATAMASAGLSLPGRATVERHVQVSGHWQQLLTILGYKVEDGRLVQQAEAAGLPQGVAQQFTPPASFVGRLRPYQLRGMGWLATLMEWGFGACLADDMGLGKTIQVIALLLWLQEQRRTNGPTLIVCPTSVVGNWRQELNRFGPSLSVYVHHGPARRRGDDLVAYVSHKQGERGPDVVVTSYPLVARDKPSLSRIAWDIVILDEAQMIKNAGTKQSRAVRGLRSNHRLALTGTPLENRLEELWSIYDFLNPGYLGNREDFRQRFVLPIEQHKDDDALRCLRSLVQPFLLRRVKSDPAIVPDLPAKQEARVYCTLTKEQATLYQAVVDQTMSVVAGLEPGIRRRGAVLSALTRLKQICDHPSLFLRDGGRIQGRSGKLKRLIELLQEVLDEGNSALIFTQFARMGEIIRNEIERQFGMKILFLHGGVPRSEREEMVVRFQKANGPSIFVLSLKAGGLGLNLTKAAYVFHYDRWWNPAVEDQATDRAFRIGQHKNVMVHKFICQGTLEERVDELIERKRHLTEQVVGAGETWLTEMSADELRSLLILGDDAVEMDE